MPYASEKQMHFMEAVRHGWRPDHMKAPSKAVAQKFHDDSVSEGKLKASVKRKMVAKALRDAP